MAVPQRRVSSTRRDKRRTHYKLSAPAVVICPECGEYPFAFGTVHSSEKYSSADSMLLSADERMYHCKERMKRLGAASRD